MTDTTQPNGRTEQSEKPKGVQLPAEIELRDYFAAAALTGLVSAMVEQSDAVMHLLGEKPAEPFAAKMAYSLADALLSARKA